VQLWQRRRRKRSNTPYRYTNVYSRKLTDECHISDVKLHKIVWRWPNMKAAGRWGAAKKEEDEFWFFVKWLERNRSNVLLGWALRVSKSYPFFFFFTIIIVLCFYYYDYESKNDGFEKENKNTRRDVVSLWERTIHFVLGVWNVNKKKRSSNGFSFWK
jgi:ATP-dependent RNA circularization protein (DNA/RNA ligase family)